MCPKWWLAAGVTSGEGWTHAHDNYWTTERKEIVKKLPCSCIRTTRAKRWSYFLCISITVKLRMRRSTRFNQLPRRHMMRQAQFVENGFGIPSRNPACQTEAIQHNDPPTTPMKREERGWSGWRPGTHKADTRPLKRWTTRQLFTYAGCMAWTLKSSFFLQRDV